MLFGVAGLLERFIAAFTSLQTSEIRQQLGHPEKTGPNAGPGPGTPLDRLDRDCPEAGRALLINTSVSLFIGYKLVPLFLHNSIITTIGTVFIEFPSSTRLLLS